MNPFLLQLLATALFATALVKDKLNLKNFNIDPRDYTFMVFFGLVFFAGLATAFTFEIKTAVLLQPTYLLALLAVVLLGFFWNKLFYFFEQKEKLQDFEIINLAVPAVTAFLGGIFFPEERSLLIFLAVAVSLLTLYAARLKRHHLVFNEYSWLVLLLIAAMALETVLRKVMLAAFDPATFYFVRTASILLLFYLFYRPRRFFGYGLKVWLHTLVPTALGTAAMILFLYGYRDIGVVPTTLVFIASPLLVYWLDARLVGERISGRTIIASLILLLAVTAAAIYG